MTDTIDMYTPEGEKLAADGGMPWKCYPRPHLKRRSFFCLNGEWELSLPDGTEHKILVPFVPQSLLSGVHRKMPEGRPMHYRKSFSLPHKDADKRYILHIDGADRQASVELNGKQVGRHVGSYDGFSLDVTDTVRPDGNTLDIYVTDNHSDLTFPYGKQCLKRGGMWYTPVSGLWQTVWLEEVPKLYVKEIHTRSDLECARIFIETGDRSVRDGRVILHDPDGDTIYEIKNCKAKIAPPRPRHWSPEDPFLYSYTIELGDDRVESYFALRSVTVEQVGGLPRLCLNGKPYFFHGLLDQGYYSDGIFLPADPEGYRRDILTAKKLGFNTLRKHIKVEPEIFYYECDRLGMIVFQDMVNCGHYSFLRDTALPTVGLKDRNDKRMHRNRNMRREFIRCMEKTVRRLSFHPSVCYWTVFNEGWGQFDHASAYAHLKKLDPTRPIDSVSGWFTNGKKTVSDITSPHIYFKDVKLTPSDKPTVISEFGGYSLKLADHSFNPVKNYGYGKFDSPESLEEAIVSLYTEQVIPAVKNGLCGAIYTQLSDVEDETNGLMTYDRRVVKVSTEKMTVISEALAHAICAREKE